VLVAKVEMIMHREISRNAAFLAHHDIVICRTRSAAQFLTKWEAYGHRSISASNLKNNGAIRGNPDFTKDEINLKEKKLSSQ